MGVDSLARFYDCGIMLGHAIGTVREPSIGSLTSAARLGQDAVMRLAPIDRPPTLLARLVSSWAAAGQED